MIRALAAAQVLAWLITAALLLAMAFVMWKFQPDMGKMRGRGELWIRYVPEAKEYMRNKKKDEIGMCQKQRNTCGNRKKMK